MASFLKWISGHRTSEGKSQRRKKLHFERLEQRRLLAADLGAISGAVFSDIDGNGLYDSAVDSGIPGIQISLTGTDDLGPVTRAPLTSDANGGYRFDNLRAGTYTLTQLPPPPVGILPTSAGQSLTVVIAPEQAAGTLGTTIDAFGGAQQTLTAVAPGAGDPVSASVVDSGALGGSRDVFVDVTSTTGITTVTSNAAFLPGVFDMNPGSSTSARYVITWDGDADPDTLSTSALLSDGIDLTNGGTMRGLLIRMGVDKSNETASLRVYSNSGNWSEATIQLPNTGGLPTGEVFVPWSAFVTGAGSGGDVTHVGAIQLEIVSSATAMDGQIDIIASRGPTVIAANFPNTLAAAGIDIEKSTNGADADTGDGPLIAGGGNAAFEYLVNTTGNTSLGAVVVTDDNGTPGNTTDDFNPVFVDGDTDGDGLLDVNETWRYQASAVAVEGAYVNLGTVQANPVSATGVDIGGVADVSDVDPSRHFGVTAGINIEKSTNGEDADDPTGPLIELGGAVNLTYVVTNTGNVALGDVQVTDDENLNVTFVDGDTDGDGLLDTNETWTYTALSQAQTGQHACSGTVVANPVFESGANIPDTPDVTDIDPSHYFGVVTVIHLEKSTNGEDADAGTGPSIPVGQPVTWLFVVTNPGNQPLHNVSLVDDAGTPSDSSDDLTPAFVSGDDNGNGLLDPTEAWLYELLGAATAGQYENRAIAAADDIFGQSVTDDDLSHYLGLEPINPNAIPPTVPNKRRFLSSTW